ncbi:hypothetical protein HANVADRAFT_47175 [Hanseniaspora valbyensis NRRL Y-1626]|uniref:Uncharacterized protein n=1 Tax=Hanseniaspora valbyensis NRRL Y-1626 TaxID=766949 RepID=A0A1B7TIM7_9ASCO|nr:hypothetical protein HANVADRAFT_47175 [Hanseniaspora valbyensis NRRL Y-1626]
MIKDILSNNNSNGNYTYHIRHITKCISMKCPDFDELSISKQRRVIMHILENETDLFEKVGWGLWRLKENGDNNSNNNNNNNIKINEDSFKKNSSEERMDSINKEDTIITSNNNNSNDTDNIKRQDNLNFNTFNYNKIHTINPTSANHNTNNNNSGVVRIRRRSSAAGNNESIIIKPNTNTMNNNDPKNSFMMPLFNSKDRTASISSTHNKKGVLLSTSSLTNINNINGNNKLIQLNKNKNISLKLNNNKYNENALESSDDDEEEEEEEDNGGGTDEEDWKTLGAENLLVNSNTTNHHLSTHNNNNNNNNNNYNNHSIKRESFSNKPHGGIVKTSHTHGNIHRTSSSSTKEENAAMLLIQLRRGSQ